MLRATLLLACLVGLASAQCYSEFFALPTVDLGNGSLAYLEYPPLENATYVVDNSTTLLSAGSTTYKNASDIALEFCKLALNFTSDNGTVLEPAVGVYRPAHPDLTIRMPLSWVASPNATNVTTCEGPTCSIFGIIECVPSGYSACPADPQGNIGNSNVGTNNIGNENSGSNNFCSRCSGSNNIGSDNSGSNNLGTFNAGSSNIGSYNSGSNVICYNQTSSNVPFEACPSDLRGPFYPTLG